MCYSSTFDVFQSSPMEVQVTCLNYLFRLSPKPSIGICGYLEQKCWTDLCLFVSLPTYPNATQAIFTPIFKPR